MACLHPVLKALRVEVVRDVARESGDCVFGYVVGHANCTLVFELEDLWVELFPWQARSHSDGLRLVDVAVTFQPSEPYDQAWEHTEQNHKHKELEVAHNQEEKH